MDSLIPTALVVILLAILAGQPPRGPSPEIVEGNLPDAAFYWRKGGGE